MSAGLKGRTQLAAMALLGATAGLFGGGAAVRNVEIVPEPPAGPEIAKGVQAMTLGRRSKYAPHQGAREVERRKRKAKP